MKKFLVLALFGAMFSASAFAQGFGATGNTTLNVTVAAAAAIRVDTATTNLTSTGNFNPYTGTTNWSYKIRTTAGTGSGQVVVKINPDFSPAGGPSVAAGNLTYSCSLTAPASGTGTACSGSVTAAATDTNVASFGANTRSTSSGTQNNSVSWSLLDDPAYATGSYSATAVFTISAS